MKPLGFLTCGILRTGKMHRWQTSEFRERQSCRTRHPALHNIEEEHLINKYKENTINTTS
jgi:hypothetical protein